MSDDKQRRRPPRPPATTTVASPEVDVQNGGNGVGIGPGYSGHEYDANDFAADRAMADSARGTPPSSGKQRPDLPPDTGRRAFFDQKTGIVRGSGAGAGGGSVGEDFDSDAAAGDGFPRTGAAPHHGKPARR